MSSKPKLDRPTLKTLSFAKTVKFRDCISKVTFPTDLSKVHSAHRLTISYILDYGDR